MLENCFTCGHSVSERARYCSKCGTNVRCKNCSEDLAKGDIVCEVCGQDVVVRQEQNSSNIVLNHIKYEDAKKGISLDARITDNFGANAAAVVGMLRGGQMPVRLPTRTPKAIPGQEELFEAAEVVSDDPASAPPPLTIQAQPLQPNKLTGIDSYLHSVFTQRDEKWRLINPNLKAKNKADFVQRATCLFLQMQQDLGNESVSRADVAQVLKDCGVFDSNVRAWLAKEKTLLRATATDITLIMPGTQYVIEILAEIMDDNVPNPWKLGTVAKTGRKAGKKDRSQQGANETEAD